LAHYAKCCYDIEYLFPMGRSELEDIANGVRGTGEVTVVCSFALWLC